MQNDSAIEFTGLQRIHIALAVTDIEKSQQFYQILLGTKPTKVRPGYVKFEPAEPSVNLTLNEVASLEQVPNTPVHYGIQVKTVQAVKDAVDRFKTSGLETLVEDATTCCYAVQDKVWVQDPDGNRWEVFVVLEADAAMRKDEASACCVDSSVNKSVNACC